MNTMDLNLEVNFIKEGASVIAYSPALDLSTSGKTERQAKKRFQEIVNVFFKDIIERGVFDDVLKELGWKKRSLLQRSSWQPPTVNHRSVSVSVPIPA